MAKRKLQRFEELKTFDNVFQLEYGKLMEEGFSLKGKWNREFFKNDNPIVLELGCGKGEYTVGLAQKDPTRNYIGVDIKGARIWRGAKTAVEKGLKNIAFVRTRIEWIDRFFGKEEVSEIWLTFPDPQLKKRRIRKRLTSPEFLRLYSNFLRVDSTIHLKTDNYVLYDYSREIALEHGHQILTHTNNLYGAGTADDILSIKTYYERKFLAEGADICYLKFKPLYHENGKQL